MVQIRQTPTEGDQGEDPVGQREEQQLNGHPEAEAPGEVVVVAAAAFQPEPEPGPSAQAHTPTPTPTQTQTQPPAQPQPTQEEQWHATLHQAEDEMRAYGAARQAGDAQREATAALHIPALLRTAGDQHPDPQVQAGLYERARRFTEASQEERDQMVHPFLQGLALLVATPFLLAGGVLFGVGKLVQGVGSLLASGPQAAYRWFGRG